MLLQAYTDIFLSNKNKPFPVLSGV